MPARMELQFSQPQSGSTSVRRYADEPLRVLVMADLSGRSGCGVSIASSPLDHRKPCVVDIDNLDSVIARLAPAVTLTLDSGGQGSSTTIEFHRIDDFHPDTLYERLEWFQALRCSRAKLLNPATFSQAVAEISTLPLSIQPEPLPPTSAVSSTPEAAVDDLARLLGKTSSPKPDTHPGGSVLQNFLQEVIQPHAVVHSDQRQSAWVDAVDTAIGERLRAVLHQPAFQALEATWRSVHQLVSRFDSETMQVYLLDVTQQELLADLHMAEGKPEDTALFRLLIDQGVHIPDGRGWSLIIGDYTLPDNAEAIALLAMLGSVAARAGGAFLAAASPKILGCESTAALADPSGWLAPAAEVEHAWQALRHSTIAPSIGLVLPRVLLRLPYGRKSDPIEAIEFEEMPMGHDAGAYLWGNPAFVCAQLLAMAFIENGDQFSPGDVLDLDDLPAHVYEEAGERLMQPATEVLLSDRAMQAIVSHGVMALSGHRSINMIRLARFQSLADPPSTLAGAWL